MGILRGILIAIGGLFTITFTGWTGLGAILGVILVLWGLLEMFGTIAGGLLMVLAWPVKGALILLAGVFWIPAAFISLFGVDWAACQRDNISGLMERIAEAGT